MKNLYLVQVADKYGPNSFLPIAISYQWMYASTSKLVKENFQVPDVLIEKKSPKQYVEDMEHEPHVMMLSSYVWNFEYNKELAKRTKEKYPNCLTITGGPHVDKRDKEFFEKYPMFDIAVMGEGENASREILKRYLKGENYNDIPHVFPKGGELCPLPTRVQDLNIIPSPILTGFYDEIMERVEKEHGPQMWQVTYETLRGCPYKCTFCDIGDDYWQKIKMFDMERVKAEIDWMADRKIEYVAVCDSNWGLMPRDVDITEYVIKTKQEKAIIKNYNLFCYIDRNKKQIALTKKNKLGFLNDFYLPPMQLATHEQKIKSWKYHSKFNNYISNKKLNINLYYKFTLKNPSNCKWFSLRKNYEFIPSFTKKIFKHISNLN